VTFVLDGIASSIDNLQSWKKYINFAKWRVLRNVACSLGCMYFGGLSLF